MKAIRLHARPGLDAMSYEDVPLPEPGHGQVRIKVHAAGLTPTELDWNETYQTADGKDRLPSIPGHDVSGVVDKLGPGVKGLAVGEAVYGLIDFPVDGSCAEYAIAPAADLAAKPRTLDHVHAAAVPLSALTAWQALFDHAKLKAGQTVLIHGAAGAVGAYAVKFAKRQGARVIVTASGRHEAHLRRIGADAIIDYTKTVFETVVHDVDLVLDPIGGDTQQRSWKVLRQGGLLISLTAPPTGQPHGVNGIFFVVRPNRDQLNEIAHLLDSGVIRPTVEAVFPLAEAKAAFERGRAGHLGGKIVLSIP